MFTERSSPGRVPKALVGPQGCTPPLGALGPQLPLPGEAFSTSWDQSHQKSRCHGSCRDSEETSGSCVRPSSLSIHLPPPLEELCDCHPSRNGPRIRGDWTRLPAPPPCMVPHSTHTQQAGTLQPAVHRRGDGGLLVGPTTHLERVSSWGGQHSSEPGAWGRIHRAGKWGSG